MAVLVYLLPAVLPVTIRRKLPRGDLFLSLIILQSPSLLAPCLIRGRPRRQTTTWPHVGVIQRAPALRHRRCSTLPPLSHASSARAPARRLPGAPLPRPVPRWVPRPRPLAPALAPPELLLQASAPAAALATLPLPPPLASFPSPSGPLCPRHPTPLQGRQPAGVPGPLPRLRRRRQRPIPQQPLPQARPPRHRPTLSPAIFALSAARLRLQFPRARSPPPARERRRRHALITDPSSPRPAPAR